MTARPSALFLAPEAPYPIAGGGALRSASLLEYLGRHYDVDVIVFRQPGAPDPASLFPIGLARRVTVLELPPNRRGSAPRYAAGGAAYSAAGGPLRGLFRPSRPCAWRHTLPSGPDRAFLVRALPGAGRARTRNAR